MADLRQLRLDGQVRRRHVPRGAPPRLARSRSDGIRAQMQQLRLLASAAEENRSLIMRWRREIEALDPTNR